MTEDILMVGLTRCRPYRPYIPTILVVGVIVAGGLTSMTSSIQLANAQRDELSNFGYSDASSKIIRSQNTQYPDSYFERPYLKHVSNLGNPMLPMQTNTRDPIIQDVISRINLSIASPLTSGQDRPLVPEYRLTQTNTSGNPDFRVFHYILKENPTQHDIEAIVAVNPVGDEYDVEVAKLTPEALKINADGEEIGMIESTNATGLLGVGFLAFKIPAIRITN